MFIVYQTSATVILKTVICQKLTAWESTCLLVGWWVGTPVASVKQCRFLLFSFILNAKCFTLYYEEIFVL